MKSTRTCSSAFSLVELLVVIGILAVLMVAAVPAMSHISRANNLARGASLVIDNMNLARQNALARNQTIEVRLYQFQPADQPGSGNHFRAIQMRQILPNGTSKPVGTLIRLPMGIIMSADQKFSTIVSKPPLEGTETLPVFGAAKYVAVRFLPSGQTNLDQNGAPNGDNWFISIHNERDTVSTGKPADNFVTAQLDPVTGHLQIFRP